MLVQLGTKAEFQNRRAGNSLKPYSVYGGIRGKSMDESRKHLKRIVIDDSKTTDGYQTCTQIKNNPAYKNTLLPTGSRAEGMIKKT